MCDRMAVNPINHIVGQSIIPSGNVQIRSHHPDKKYMRKDLSMDGI
jgi:hypothetical protein